MDTPRVTSSSNSFAAWSVGHITCFHSLCCSPCYGEHMDSLETLARLPYWSVLSLLLQLKTWTYLGVGTGGLMMLGNHATWHYVAAADCDDASDWESKDLFGWLYPSRACPCQNHCYGSMLPNCDGAVAGVLGAHLNSKLRGEAFELLNLWIHPWPSSLGTSDLIRPFRTSLRNCS